MSTATASPAGGHPVMSIDTTATPQVPITRLAAVEMRKALDTRAGRWFTASILGLVLVVEVIYAFAAHDDSKDLSNFMPIAGGVLGYFLPILIIMLVTSEASQRNGLITFTLEPRRPRVVLAKFIAGVGLALGVLVLAMVLAIVGTLIGGLTGGSPSWSVEGHLLFNGFLLTNMINVFTGFAIGMLIMNTAGGIVGYFAYSLILPIAVGILSALSSGFEKVAPWIEFNTAQTPLVSGDYTPSAEQWVRIAVAGFIWLIVPLGLGIWRLLRTEFK